MARRDPLTVLHERVSKLKTQRRFTWVERFALAPVTDGYDAHGVDVQVVVRSGITDVFEDADRMNELADQVHRIFQNDEHSELYPYVTFASADELQELAMMLTNEEFAAIEAAWQPDEGAMWKLRQGDVDASQIESLLRVLEGIQVAENDQLPRRFVSFVWFLPIFFEWQRERVAERGGDMRAFEVLASRSMAVVEGLLGLP